MPVAIYLGIQELNLTDYILCCHGGLELGFNASKLLNSQNEFQLLRKLKRSKELQKLSKNNRQEIELKIPQYELMDTAAELPTKPVTLGFMWSDFCTNKNVVEYTLGRGWKLEKI